MPPTVGRGSELALAGEMLHRPPLPLGRPAGSRHPLGSGRIGALQQGVGRRRHILHKRTGGIGRPAPLGEAGDHEHPHAAVERHRQNITQAHQLARTVDAAAVEAHMTG
jgi:hypothetical protein